MKRALVSNDEKHENPHEIAGIFPGPICTVPLPAVSHVSLSGSDNEHLDPLNLPSHPCSNVHVGTMA